MNLIRRQNFPALTSFQDEVNDVFSRFFGPMALTEARTWLPAVNVEDSDKEIVVTAELPGIDPKDVTITVEGRDLVISGERKNTRTEKKPTYYREEISFGSFVRRLPLPAEVIIDKAAADYRSGLLRVTLPKTEASKRAKIPIHTTKE